MALGAVPWTFAQTRPASPSDAGAASARTLVDQYCTTCHNQEMKTGGVSLEALDLTHVGGSADVLEKVVRKVRSGQMPPAGMPRPAAAAASSFVKWLEDALDRNAALNPNPGRPVVHRLNRAEYSNAIRDLLALDIHPGDQLPVDDSGYGFDNIGDVLSVSPALLDRYLSVARKISRLAIGDPTIKPVEEAFEPRRSPGRGAPVPPRLEWVSDDLPFNSAGGVSVRYYFPLDAEYVLRVNFGNPGSPGAAKPLEVRIPIKAGLRAVAATFPRESARPELLPLGGRGGPEAMAPVALDLRLDGTSLKRSTTPGAAGSLPRITNLSIAGPYNATGPGDTPSRRRILVCH